MLLCLKSTTCFFCVFLGEHGKGYYGDYEQEYAGGGYGGLDANYYPNYDINAGYGHY